MTGVNREAWLNEAVSQLRPVFKDRTGLGLPDVHVSVGWPSKGGTSTKRRRVGECWAATSSSDETAHIFISPMLEDAFDVLAVLVHELVHALHPGAGHRGDFVKTAKEIGLIRPWTATSAGENLEPVITRLISELGEFPHAKITPMAKKAVQTTRMRKVTCPVDGYIVRTTAKWLEIGIPTCPCGTEMEVSE